MKRITPTEIIDLVKSLPDADKHIHQEYDCQCITQEWLCGNFAGRGFVGDTIEEAAEKMIQYLYDHIGHKSMVGDSVTNSGFPDLKQVENYCLSFSDDD